MEKITLAALGLAETLSIKFPGSNLSLLNSQHRPIQFAEAMSLTIDHLVLEEGDFEWWTSDWGNLLND